VPHMLTTARYSVVDDFEPIVVTGVVPVALMVSKNVKAGNLKAFIEEMRANPGKYSYAGGGGSPPHVMGAWMNKLKGLNVMHVPYRGGSQGINDVVGGHIDMMYAGIAAGIGVINTGGVRALAVTGDKRSSALPNVQGGRRAGVRSRELERVAGAQGFPGADLVTAAQRDARCAKRPGIPGSAEPLGH
jgi:tripartite-type tricarboxylate transporter receptor subunit TctC